MPDPRIARLEEQLADLVAELDRLEGQQLASQRIPAQTHREEKSQGLGAEDQARVEDLTRRLAQLEFERAPRTPRLPQVDEQELFDQQRARREEAEGIILDHQDRTDRQKAQAWHYLANLESAVWTDEIVSVMTHIGTTSTDDRAREAVWIGADGQHRSDPLVQPLLSGLSGRVANVREEAADALGHYLDVPGVREALLWSSENDSSEVVRDEALRVLSE